MEATKKNEETAREIINIFADKKYTVNEANDVLHYVRNAIQANMTVQRVNEKLFDDSNWPVQMPPTDCLMIKGNCAEIVITKEKITIEQC